MTPQEAQRIVESQNSANAAQADEILDDWETGVNETDLRCHYPNLPDLVQAIITLHPRARREKR